MKRILFPIILVLVLLLSSTVCFAADRELRFSPSYIIPGDDDTWDNALGIDVQYIVWNTPTLGFAASGGIGSWNVNDELLIDYEAGYAMEIDGSATMLPLGASVLYRPSTSSSAKITFEAGLRYVIVNSGINIAATDGYYYLEDEVDIDNGLVGIIGADLEFPLSPTANFGLGAGYQSDLSKGDASWFGVELGDNELKGLFIRIGLTLKI